MNRDNLSRPSLNRWRCRSLVAESPGGKTEHRPGPGFEVEKAILQAPAIEVGQRIGERICAEM